MHPSTTISILRVDTVGRKSDVVISEVKETDGEMAARVVLQVAINLRYHSYSTVICSSKQPGQYLMR